MRRCALAALIAAALVFPAAAAAQGSLDKAISSLRRTPVYVSPSVNLSITRAQTAQLRHAIGDSPIYIAILPASARQEAGGDANDVLRALRRGVGKPGSYAVVAGGQFRAGSDDPDFQGAEVAALATAAFRIHQNDGLAATLLDFVRRVEAARDDTGGAGVGSKIGVLLALGAGAGGGFLLIKRRRRRQQTGALKQVVKEDLIALGDDIRALDLDIEMPSVTQAAKDDYADALLGYERASRGLDRARQPGDLRAVTDALDRGRYAMTSAKARLSGEEPPERTPPCFFDPRHGPSVRDLDWAPPGGVSRPVPVCAVDAKKLENGEEPQSREVVVGGRRVPYWESAGFGPYADGYFGGYGGNLLPGLIAGTALGYAVSQGASDAHASTDDFSDPGGGDFGGGFDGSGGGDFGGGGMSGGGDFGGGGNGGGG